MPATQNADIRLRRHRITLAPLTDGRIKVIARHSRGADNVVTALPRASVVARIVEALDAGDGTSREIARRVVDAVRVN